MVKTKELQRYLVQLIGECFGTCILILIGESGIANYKFARQTSHSTLPISFAFGVGVYTGYIINNNYTRIRINFNLIEIKFF